MVTSSAPIWGIPDDHKIETDVFAAAQPTWHLPRDIWTPIRRRNQGQGVRVAVLDTGVDLDHPLLPSPVISASFISGESVEDRNSHGTHCSGTVLGRDFDIGVAPEAELVIGKVLSNRGSGSSAGIARGIRWAVDVAEADIISLSLGGPSAYRPTIEAIRYAFSKGVIVVIAAGNSGFSGRGNTIGWPARSGEGITVAAMQQNGNIAGFSSGGEQVIVAAPGQQILSTVRDGRLGMMSGTSMATPYVAGCFALIVSMMRRAGYARWTAVESVNNFVERNSKDHGRPGRDPRFGYGSLKMTDIVERMAENTLLWTAA